MLIATSTNTFSELSTVSSSMFSSILPYLYVIIGIILAFYIIETIRFWFSDYPERYNKLEKEKEETRKKDFRDVLEEEDYFEGSYKARQYENKYDIID